MHIEEPHEDNLEICRYVYYNEYENYIQHINDILILSYLAHQVA